MKLNDPAHEPELKPLPVVYLYLDSPDAFLYTQKSSVVLYDRKESVEMDSLRSTRSTNWSVQPQSCH